MQVQNSSQAVAMGNTSSSAPLGDVLSSVQALVGCDTVKPVANLPTYPLFINEVARKGDLTTLDLCLKENPALVWSISASDKRTPWHQAASAGHSDTLGQLIEVSEEEGALSIIVDPTSNTILNQVDDQGQTPLMLACKGGHHACAQLLLRYGADIYPADAQGFTALHYAAMAPGGGECVVLLLRQARRQDKRYKRFISAGDTSCGRTPLHFTCWSGHLEGTKELLAAGASMFAQTTAHCSESDMACNMGSTPLHLAALRGHQSILAAILARFLSEGGVLDLHPDPRPCLDMTKNTPYETAVQQGHCTPFIMEALNPLTPASQLHRLCNKQLEKATAVVCLAPPGRQPDSPTRMLAIGGIARSNSFDSGSSTCDSDINSSSYDSASDCSESFDGSSSQPQGTAAAPTISFPAVQSRRSSLSSSLPTPPSQLATPWQAWQVSLTEPPAPNFFLCSLTGHVFKDPVIAADGHTYERFAIERHLATGSMTSPSTRQRMPSALVFPNLTLKSAIEHWRMTHKAADGEVQ